MTQRNRPVVIEMENPAPEGPDRAPAVPEPGGLPEGSLAVSGEAASATDDPQPQDNADFWDLSVGPARD